MYHHTEGYPNPPQHSNTEGTPAVRRRGARNRLTSVSWSRWLERRGHWLTGADYLCFHWQRRWPHSRLKLP